MTEGGMKHALRSKDEGKIKQALHGQKRRQAGAQDRYDKLNAQRKTLEKKYGFESGGLAGFEMGGPSLAIKGHEENIGKLEAAIKKSFPTPAEMAAFRLKTGKDYNQY